MSKTNYKNDILDFYNKFLAYSNINNSEAVAWTSKESQVKRFEILLDIGINKQTTKLENIKCEDFLLQNNKFHIIFGNPPYVRIQNLNKEYLNYLKLDLDSIKIGNVDLYFALRLCC